MANLRSLYTRQTGSTLGKRRPPKMPLVERREADKPGWKKSVLKMTALRAAADQKKRQRALEQEGLHLQREAADKANRIRAVGMGMDAAKLGASGLKAYAAAAAAKKAAIAQAALIKSGYAPAGYALTAPTTGTAPAYGPTVGGLVAPTAGLGGVAGGLGTAGGMAGAGAAGYAGATAAGAFSAGGGGMAGLMSAIPGVGIFIGAGMLLMKIFGLGPFGEPSRHRNRFDNVYMAERGMRWEPDSQKWIPWDKDRSMTGQEYAKTQYPEFARSLVHNYHSSESMNPMEDERYLPDEEWLSAGAWGAQTNEFYASVYGSGTPMYTNKLTDENRDFYERNPYDDSANRRLDQQFRYRLKSPTTDQLEQVGREILANYAKKMGFPAGGGSRATWHHKPGVPNFWEKEPEANNQQ